MKKVILSILVAGSLLATGCKKAKDAASDVKKATENVANDATKAADKVVDGAKGAVDGAVKAVESAIEGVSIPAFADEKVTAYVKEYADYAKKYIDAGGDVVKNADLAKTGTALATKGAELAKTMDADTKAKFDTVMNAIKSKMAPAK